eukprot:CAMPEP_0117605134 /NCGR_PEP_ID=MMETSP0784-20121206/79040_1 /TAXON_ID=39447 /ORGANISM="" /LENGTH=555 /DNA_ID=CAMNT_0005408175 /DNA_START=43 /DNA_END=1707 /DNA_ORIENTATION=-
MNATAAAPNSAYGSSTRANKWRSRGKGAIPENCGGDWAEDNVCNLQPNNASNVWSPWEHLSQQGCVAVDSRSYYPMQGHHCKGQVEAANPVAQRPPDAPQAIYGYPSEEWGAQDWASPGAYYHATEVEAQAQPWSPDIFETACGGPVYQLGQHHGVYPQPLDHAGQQYHSCPWPVHMGHQHQVVDPEGQRNSGCARPAHTGQHHQRQGGQHHSACSGQVVQQAEEQRLDHKRAVAEAAIQRTIQAKWAEVGDGAWARGRQRGRSYSEFDGMVVSTVTEILYKTPNGNYQSFPYRATYEASRWHVFQYDGTSNDLREIFRSIETPLDSPAGTTIALEAEAGVLKFVGRRAIPPGRAELLSHKLSSALRYADEDLVSKWAPWVDGFVKVSDVLATRSFHRWAITLPELKWMVDSNTKKRFGLLQVEMENEDGEQTRDVWMIRATQGHGGAMGKVVRLDAVANMEITNPDMFDAVYHGTSRRNAESIKRRGLMVSERDGRDIHMIDKLPESGEVCSGMRPGCDWIVRVDMRRAMQAGVRFFLSANGVILSRGLDGVIP